jgi:murein DD-endopeptidase MepM/ murein hydrolase activator NlpD
MLGILLFFIVPTVLGCGAWFLTAKLNDTDTVSGIEQISEQKIRLASLEAEINAIKTRSAAELDALSIQLGRMQAESMRTDALGQRLAEMAGLDKQEFDFSSAPGVGGAEPGMEMKHLGIDELKNAIDETAMKLSRERMELGLLEAMMIDRGLKKSMNPMGWPVKRGYISSAYGYRNDPFTGKKSFHKGVDIPSAEGAPIFALAAGVVTFAGDKHGFGNMVEIDHGHGYTTRYAHISTIAVKTGERVGQNQEIAKIGSTGRSTGPHLHLEMLKDGRTFNPRKRLYSGRKSKDS